MLADAGFETSTAAVDVSLRESVLALIGQATALGDVTGLVHAAGVPPSQAPTELILRVDLYSTALVLEEFGSVIAPRFGSRHRLSVGPPTARPDPRAGPGAGHYPGRGTPVATDAGARTGDRPLNAYQLSKRGNVLRVMAEAVRWSRRRARVNAISPGIIITPLARDELTGPRGEGYRRMLSQSPAGRAGTPDEVATVAALLMGPDGAFITGTDVLMDGGVTASYFYGELAPK